MLNKIGRAPFTGATRLPTQEPGERADQGPVPSHLLPSERLTKALPSSAPQDTRSISKSPAKPLSPAFLAARVNTQFKRGQSPGPGAAGHAAMMRNTTAEERREWAVRGGRAVMANVPREIRSERARRAWKDRKKPKLGAAAMAALIAELRRSARAIREETGCDKLTVLFMLVSIHLDCTNARRIHAITDIAMSRCSRLAKRARELGFWVVPSAMYSHVDQGWIDHWLQEHSVNAQEGALAFLLDVMALSGEIDRFVREGAVYYQSRS